MDVIKLIAPVLSPVAPVINKIIESDNSVKQAKEKPMQGSSSSGTVFNLGERVKILPNTSSSFSEIPKAVFPACYIGDDLMHKYNELITELQHAQNENNQGDVNDTTQKIIDLKTKISASKTNCGVGVGVSVSAAKSGVVSAGTVKMTRCEEAKSLQEKLNYYQNLSNSSDADLKSKTNLSMDDVKNTLREISDAINIAQAQCNGSTATSTSSDIQIQAEPMKPIGVQSAQEIKDYYKAKIEAALGAQSSLTEVQQLEQIKKEKDQLLGDLFKNKKDIQTSDLKDLVNKIQINKNEISADGASVAATGNTISLNIGSGLVSITPTGNSVVIKDKNLNVSTDNISVASGTLSIDGKSINLLASQVAEKLNIAPQAVQLTTENSQPVYKMQISEVRKLFGLIKINAQNTATADANSGNLISQTKPWYYFLTTK